MLKWTKRAEPSVCGGDATSTNLSALILSQNTQRTHTRRSLGNLNRPQQRCRSQHRQRKSLGSSELCKRMQRDKENHHIQLTPHPYGARQNVSSTPVIAFGSKMDTALRDVQNITPKQQQSNSNSITALLNAMTPSRKRPLAKSPPSSPCLDRVICSSPKETALTIHPITKHTPYASTLPTFDVEYSPCGAAPQPILAKTVKNPVSTITDSLFNHPRYFQEPLPATKRLKFSPGGMTPLSSRLSELRFSKAFKGPISSAKKPRTIKSDVSSMDEHSNNNNNDKQNKNQNIGKKFPAPPTNASDVSLSSSALDDTDLDKMIDAILESARKDRPSIVRNLVPNKIQIAMQVSSLDSPTYTAAEDPASDLNKFCDNFQISAAELAAERTIILDEPHVINEREVRTPEPLEQAVDVEEITVTAPATAATTVDLNCSRTGHLRRQRAVRRKTNATKNGKKDATSAEKVHAVQVMDVEMTTVTTAQQSPKLEELSDAERLTREAIHITSPKTPEETEYNVLSAFFKKSNDELADMNTPIIADTDANKPHMGITSITSKMSTDSTPCIHSNDLQASSTPTDTVKSIRRCLTFSDSPSTTGSTTAASDDSSLEKRKSTASSTNSTASVSNLSNSGRSTVVSGSLDLHICSENNKILIHGELV